MNEFTDDPTITDDSTVWRRIPQSWVVSDDNLKRKRPSTQCFLQDGPTGPLSVYIAAEAQSVQAVMQGAPEPFLVSLNVGFLRRLNLGITRDQSSGGPGHALVIGKKTGSIRNQMAQAAIWVKPYDPPS